MRFKPAQYPKPIATYIDRREIWTTVKQPRIVVEAKRAVAYYADAAIAKPKQTIFTEAMRLEDIAIIKAMSRKDRRKVPKWFRKALHQEVID